MTLDDWTSPDAMAAWLLLFLALAWVIVAPRSTLARQWRALTRGVSE